MRKNPFFFFKQISFQIAIANASCRSWVRDIVKRICIRKLSKYSADIQRRFWWEHCFDIVFNDILGTSGLFCTSWHMRIYHILTSTRFSHQISSNCCRSMVAEKRDRTTQAQGWLKIWHVSSKNGTIQQNCDHPLAQTPPLETSTCQSPSYYRGLSSQTSLETMIHRMCC